MPDVFERLQTLGFAVVMDYQRLKDPTGTTVYSLFQEQNAPTAEQASYYKTANSASGGTRPIMETIFEGVKVNNGSMGLIPVKPTVAREGTELRAVLAYGTKFYKAYQKQWKGQADDIIRAMFQKHARKNGSNPAADPSNWFTAHNIVVGGQDHQHPHCDQGMQGSFASETIFPFVAVHGFGINAFQMWILPMKNRRDYGFLYQFPKTAILFLRGDCPHAGACLQEARDHISFWPQAEAGWDEENPYWAPNNIEAWLKDQVIFLTPELRLPPFAWPQFGKRTQSGDQIVTYPADETTDLITPVARTKPKYVRKRKHEGKQDCTMKKEKHEDDAADCEAEFQKAKKNFRHSAEFQVAKKNKDESTAV
jgi:hypothetical protein